jgi:ADP-ribose pyrophosphatase YjhB (NUDIX family)
VSGDVVRDERDSAESLAPDGDDGQAVAAASAILFRGPSVLLVRRRGPEADAPWSFPGGHVEAGETAEAAARREVREETGLEATLLGRTAIHHHVANGRRYRITVFHGTADGGEPVAGSDARAARFVPLHRIGALELTPGAAALIQQALTLMAPARRDATDGER